MFPYIINYLKKAPKGRRNRKNGQATDCLIEEEVESILKVWRGEATDSVRILDKVIPKIGKYKRGGVGGTPYNQSDFILPTIDRSAENVSKYKSKELDLEALLLELLVEGYHMVFEEVYHLIQMDMMERKEYEKEFGVLKTVPLHLQLDTIQFIVKFLKDAETAKNNDDFGLLFKCHLNLAKTFAEKDNPLAARFFDLCLKCATEYPCDNDGSSLALSSLHLGLYAKSNDNMDKAFGHLMYVYQYTRGKDTLPLMEDKRTMFSHATQNLVLVCLSLGKAKQAHNFFGESEDYFSKAFKFAKENGDVMLTIDAMYNLGTFCTAKKDYKQALEYLKECLTMCEELSDWIMVATVCQAIGAVYFRLDDLDKAKEYYARFVEVSDGAEDKNMLTESYMQTGLAFNNAGHYDLAVGYVMKAYGSVNEDPELDKYEVKARTLLGITKGHSKLSLVTPYILKKNLIAMETLLDWKEFRICEFKPEIPKMLPAEIRQRREVCLKQMMKQVNCSLNDAGNPVTYFADDSSKQNNDIQ